MSNIVEQKKASAIYFSVFVFFALGITLYLLHRINNAILDIQKQVADIKLQLEDE